MPYKKREHICQMCQGTYITDEPKSRYCKACRSKASANSRYKGGHIGKDGYRRIMVGRIPHLEHRLVMEQSIGRKLLKGEEVHHKDGNRLNNHIDNLQLLESRAKHRHLHRKLFLSETHKECSICHEIKTRSDFYLKPTSSSNDKLRAECKSCTKKRSSEQWQKIKKGVLPKFSNGDIQRIRQAASKDIPLQILATTYSTSYQTIWRIVKHKMYATVP